VLDRCLSKKGNSVVTQVLVKWTSVPAEMATSENYEVLKANFLAAAASTPTASSAGGNVIPMAG
jgi:hypothetical protein